MFVSADRKMRITAEIIPRANVKPVCSGCGKQRPGNDRIPEPREFQFIPVWNIHVTFSYLNVIAAMLPLALTVLDRIHIAEKLGEAVDEVRRQEAKKLDNEGYESILKNSRQCFLKRPHNFTIRQATKIG